MRVVLDSRGPVLHGAVGHAAALARLLREAGHVVVPAGAADVTHAQFTDGLWGENVARAASCYVEWAARVAGPVVVTLHDVPGADPDPARDLRRIAGYARVVAASAGVIVSAKHEAVKVRRISPGCQVEVIDLPLPRLPGPTPSRPGWADQATLGVLGFIYPGKGHEAVLACAARQPSPPRVVALGGVSPGHERLSVALIENARDLGVDLVVTGCLSNAELVSGMAAVTVPVAAAPAVSASASLLSWLAALRRPVTAAGAYAAEIGAAHPGLLELYHHDAELDELVAGALEAPERTLLGSRPDWPDATAGHLGVYTRVLRRYGGAGEC